MFDAARAIVSVVLVASVVACGGDVAQLPSAPEPVRIVEAPLGDPTDACEVVRRDCGVHGDESAVAALRADERSVCCLRLLEPRDQLATLRELIGFFAAGELRAYEIEAFQPLPGRVEILDLRKREEVIGKIDIELEPASVRPLLIVCISNHTARVVFQPAPGARALHVEVAYAAKRDAATTPDGLRFAGQTGLYSIRRPTPGEVSMVQRRDMRSAMLGIWSYNGLVSERVADYLTNGSRIVEADEETQRWYKLPLAEWPEPVIGVHLFVP